MDHDDPTRADDADKAALQEAERQEAAYEDRREDRAQADADAAG